VIGLECSGRVERGSRWILFFLFSLSFRLFIVVRLSNSSNVCFLVAGNLFYSIFSCFYIDVCIVLPTELRSYVDSCFSST